MGQSAAELLAELDHPHQVAVIMKANGDDLKTIAATTNASYNNIRKELAPNAKRRNQVMLDAVDAIRAETAAACVGLPQLIVDRCKQEIARGDSATSHHYLKIGREMIRDLSQDQDKQGKGMPGIQALIQTFNTTVKQSVSKKEPILPVVVDSVDVA